MASQSKAKSLAGRHSDGVGGKRSGGHPSVAEDASTTGPIGEQPGTVDNAGRATVSCDGAGTREALNVPMSCGDLRRQQGYTFTFVLQRHHAEQLARLVRGLEDRERRLKDGRLVTDRTKALRWLLENINPCD